MFYGKMHKLSHKGLKESTNHIGNVHGCLSNSDGTTEIRYATPLKYPTLVKTRIKNAR